MVTNDSDVIVAMNDWRAGVSCLVPAMKTRHRRGFAQ